MKFFVIIGRNGLYTYEIDGQKYHSQFIEGSEYFPINISSVSEDVNSYLDALANEKNLGTRAKLEFDVLEGADAVVNAGVFSVLEEYTVQRYPLGEALKTVLKKLSRDKKLLIAEYGINYDGYSYKAVDKDVLKGEFDLLAYTIHGDDVISMMNTK